MCLIVLVQAASPAEVHGGTLLAIKGKDSVVIACDSRFSSHRSGGMLIGNYRRSLHRVGSSTVVGCIGLDSDSRILIDELKKKLSDHMDDEIQPHNIAKVLKGLLFMRGLYCAPMIIGMNNYNEPYICQIDSTGGATVPEDFAVDGSAMKTLYAICEKEYTPQLGKEDLLELAKRIMTMAMQRDVVSGGPCQLFIMDRHRKVENIKFDTDDAY